MLAATRDHTPGYAGLAQPYPQDVAPSTNQKPPFSQTNGPPLSPWQASVVPPLLLPLAQIISSVIPPEWSLLHCSFVLISTIASWRMSGRLPPEDSVPQPVIQQSVPAATVVSGRQAALTPGPKSKGGSTLNSMRSLLYWDGELYDGCFLFSTIVRDCPELVWDLLWSPAYAVEGLPQWAADSTHSGEMMVAPQPPKDTCQGQEPSGAGRPFTICAPTSLTKGSGLPGLAPQVELLC